jgi:hypothetical protein
MTFYRIFMFGAEGAFYRGNRQGCPRGSQNVSSGKRGSKQNPPKNRATSLQTTDGTALARQRGFWFRQKSRRQGNGTGSSGMLMAHT